MRRRSLCLPLLAALACMVLPGAAAAQEQVLGSGLDAAPNWSVGCEWQLGFFDEAATAQGNYSPLLTNQDCTWFTPASVPGNGRIRHIDVLAGQGATQIRFVVMRSLIARGAEQNGGCCFFVAEYPPNPQPPLTLTPGGVNGFDVDIPVERSTSERTGIISADIVGISAVPNTGELPLRIFASTNTLAGPTSAGFYYPRLGALPSDQPSSRNPSGIPGVEVLMRAIWVPAGTPGGGTGGSNPAPVDIGGGPQSGATPPVQTGIPPAASFLPTLRTGALPVTAGQAVADLVCQGNAACAGALALLARGARAAQSGVVTYGRRRYAIAAGASKKVKVKLNKKGRKLLRKRRRLKLTLQLTPDGGTPSSVPVTLRARKR